MADMTSAPRLAPLINALEGLETRRMQGRVRSLQGLVIEAAGPPEALALGARGMIETDHGPAQAEIVGFRGERALLMAYDAIEGVRPGAPVMLDGRAASVRPSRAWLGRVVDAFGEPVDGGPALPQGAHARLVKATPLPAHAPRGAARSPGPLSKVPDAPGARGRGVPWAPA